MSQRALLFTLCSLSVAACSGSPAAPDTGPDGQQDMATSPPTPDLSEPLPPGTRVMRLIASDFNIKPGTEGYQCQRVTIPSDIYILKITPVSPTGVHHEVLAIDPGTSPDGVSDCGPLDPSWKPLFASGVGSPSLTMPKGIAFKVAAGSKVVLDLHLFNARPDNNITGNAAVDVVVADTNDGYQLAALPFIGPLNFTVPATGRSVSGSCTVSNDTTFFAVFPHMHTTGQHIKITAGKTGSPTTVWDQDYSFTEQKFGQFPNWDTTQAQVPLKKGDKISVTCTYTQDGVGKKFGDSTTDEMCFAISYVTPAISTLSGSAFCAF